MIRAARRWRGCALAAALAWVGAAVAAPPGYPLALQQEWQQEFSEFTQDNFRGLLAPLLTADEQQRLRGLRFEFPLGAREQPMDFHAVSDGRVVLPVESLLLLKDLAGASAWLSLRGHAVAPVFDYAAVLANGGLAAWPAARRLPKDALGVPAQLGGDAATLKRYEDLLLSSVLFIVGHELGHLLHGIEDPARATPAARQAAERRADAFALELFRRAQLAPFGAAFFFGVGSRLVPLAGLTGDEARWRARVAAASHPLDGDRIAAAADAMAARQRDFERAFTNPQTAPARVQGLIAELRKLAELVGRREAAILQADCALTYEPDDLLPRRDALFDLRPAAGERFAAEAWSGVHEGEVTVAASGQRTALRAILRRDGERLLGATQHLCFRGRLDGRIVGDRASLVWSVGDSRRSLNLGVDASGRVLDGRWQSLARPADGGEWRLRRLP